MILIRKLLLSSVGAKRSVTVRSLACCTTLATRRPENAIHKHASNTLRSLANTSGPRPFRILGVQQVAIGSEDREGLRRLWVDVLGVPVQHEGIRMERENVVEDILSVGGVEIDLMTPIDPQKSPKVHVPPLNHIGKQVSLHSEITQAHRLILHAGLWVDDLDLAVEWMISQGVRFAPGGIRKGAAGHNVAFIHPKSNDQFPVSGNGVLVELVQAPDNLTL